MVKNKVPKNSLFTIRPYKKGGLWVFDEPAVGLLAEPFVHSATHAIDRMLMAETIFGRAGRGFNLTFSDNWFPNFTAKATKMPIKFQSPIGTMYHWAEQDIEFWLCPALEKFFASPPNALYAKVSL